jgi:ABC-2 type transport system ATP-binding protein
VRELNLMVPRGEVFGFLGPNGAGKTTTIRMMLGLIQPTSGSAYINGVDIHKDPMDALKFVGAIAETPAFYGYLSGRANLELLGRISGGVTRKRVDEALEIVGLSGRGEDKVKGYSQGMRQRLGLAQALLSEPDMVILDEPTNGLDPSGMIEIRRLIKQLAKGHGMTVFLSSHLLHEVEAVCGRVAVINNGELVAQGPVSEFLQKETVQLEVRVSDRQRAKTVLDGLGFILSITEENGGVIVVEVGGDMVAEVNRALVTGGVDVSALVPREASLEDFFLKLTGGATGDRGGRA